MTVDGQSVPELTKDAVAELGRIVLARHSLPEALEKVAHSAKRTIPGAAEVSVTFLEGERASTVAYTGDFALRLDETQYEFGAGPCLDAAASAQTFVIADMAKETRWPDYTPVAAGIGACSSMSIPVPVQEKLTAALNIYATEPNMFGDESLHAATSFASYAAVAISNAHDYSSAATLAAQMQEAMQSRAVIEQAKGILMAKHHCNADAAFALLTRMSQNSNTKLRDLAASLVEQTQQVN